MNTLVLFLILASPYPSFADVPKKCLSEINDAIKDSDRYDNANTVSLSPACQGYSIKDLDPELTKKLSLNLFQGAKNSTLTPHDSLTSVLGRVLVRSMDNPRAPKESEPQHEVHKSGDYCVTTENRPGKYTPMTQEVLNLNEPLVKRGVVSRDSLGKVGDLSCDATSSEEIGKDKIKKGSATGAKSGN